MKVKVCPKCESSEVVPVAGAVGGMWECKSCNFRSVVFPEKEIDDNESKEDNKI